MSRQDLKHSGRLSPNLPLWQRVPTRDAQGKSLFDFIMFIPKLNKATEQHQQQVLNDLQAAFDSFGDEVVFADLNLQKNLLWISLKPRQGLSLALAEAVQARVPQAVLVASKVEAMMGVTNIARRRWGLKLLS